MICQRVLCCNGNWVGVTCCKTMRAKWSGRMHAPSARCAMCLRCSPPRSRGKDGMNVFAAGRPKKGYDRRPGRPLLTARSISLDGSNHRRAASCRPLLNPLPDQPLRPPRDCCGNQRSLWPRVAEALRSQEQCHLRASQGPASKRPKQKRPLSPSESAKV